MRICLVIPNFWPIIGGAENQALAQAVELTRRGHSVSVLTWRWSQALATREEIQGVTVHRISRPERGRFNALRSRLAMLRALLHHARACDILLARTVVDTAYLASVAAYLRRKPVAAVVVTTPGRSRQELHGADKRFRRVKWGILRRRGVIIAMTARIEDGVRSRGFRRVVRIPNGVLETVFPDRDALAHTVRQELGVPSASQLVVAVGHMSRVKGFDVLIDAWPQVHGSCPEARLALVGSGSQQGALQSAAAAGGSGETIVFAGGSTEARTYIAAADVVVISSRYEGMSNVLLEAMAAGVPVVSTRISGSEDVIVDGVNGRLVPVDDPEALAAAIRDLLSSPGTIGMEGRRTVLARCDMRRVVDLLEELFRRIESLPPGVTNLDAEMPLYPSGYGG